MSLIRCAVSGGGQARLGAAIPVLAYAETLMDAAEEPSHGVAAIHVEGLPREGERSPGGGIDYELTHADGRVMQRFRSKHERPDLATPSEGR
jgi:hypothetical protein